MHFNYQLSRNVYEGGNKVMDWFTGRHSRCNIYINVQHVMKLRGQLENTISTYRSILPALRGILKKQDKHFDFPGLVESLVISGHLIDTDRD